MILRTLLKKPEVSHITVLERYQDVVDLVMPSLIAFLAQWDRDDFPPRLEVIRADVFQWEPPTDLAKFHTIYFDIWPASKVRHLPEMHLLHKRYRPLLAKGGWMSSWTYDKLRKREKDDADFLRQLPAQLEDGWRRNTREYSIQAIHLMLGVDPEVISDTEKRVIREWALAKGIDV
jgi:spermidine synthase